MTPAACPASEDRKSGPTGQEGRRRGLAYLVLLGAGSAVILFADLDKRMLVGDEAIYAQVVDHMRSSGDWIYLNTYQPTPYFDKPPLYCWLTAATFRVLSPGIRAYRVWSAGFGVGCVILTGALGMLLFSPEVGLIAGLFLLTNQQFVFCHGAREGCFDTALTFFSVLCFLLAGPVRRARRGWLSWALIGPLAAAACLLKPMAGVPVIAIVGLHGLLVDRRRPLASRLGGPLLAAIGCLTLALPWYVAQWHRYGDGFITAIFWTNLVRRATAGLCPDQVHGPTYYLVAITRSSAAFTLFLPALAIGAILSRSGHRRKSFGFLVFITTVFILGISLSKSKMNWYAYPIYPVIAVMIAGLVSETVRRLAHWAGRRPGRALVLRAAAALALWMTGLYVVTVRAVVFEKRWEYGPWRLYRSIEPTIARGAARFICYHFLRPNGLLTGHPGFDFTDKYYLRKMRQAIWVDDLKALRAILADGRPAFILVGADRDLGEVKRGLGRTQAMRIISISNSHQRLPLLAIHSQ